MSDLSQGAEEISDETGTAKGRWVGETLYWDIGDETIIDADLRKWVWMNLPEDSLFRHVGTCVLGYHTKAYANRRRAIAEFMK